MSEATTGRRILGEIEETSLDEVLTTFRTSIISTSSVRSSSSVAIAAHTHNHVYARKQGGGNAPSLAKVKSYPIPLLDTLVSKHFRATQSAPLTLSGAHLPLLYKLLATLITAPQNKAVVVIDIEARFDITRVLQCASYPSAPATDHTCTTQDFASSSPIAKNSFARRHKLESNVPDMGSQQEQDCTSTTHEHRVSVEDLKHVHVYRPARGSPSYIRDVLTSAEHFIVYTRHASVAREWWGTIVVGGGSPKTLDPGYADVTTGWKGWLRIDREETAGFPLGMCAEEALVDRDQRQRAVDASGYTATCAWGAFTFREAADE